MPGYNDLVSQRSAYFNQRRQEAQGNANKAQQEGEDALSRRFSSLNMQGSGANIAANLKNREQTQESLNKANTDIAGQELQAGEGDIGRAFNSEEAQKGRDFGAEEANRGRIFQGNEAERGRAFQGGLAGQDLEFKRKVAENEQANKLQEIELAKQQFALDKDTTEFNKRMAEIEASRPASKGPLGNIFGGLQNPGGSIFGENSDIGKAYDTYFDAFGGKIYDVLGGGGK